MNLTKILFIIGCFFSTSSCAPYTICLKNPCMAIPLGTKASPIQQTYAAVAMFENANMELPQCNEKDMHVISTKVNTTVAPGFEKDALRLGLWEETWVLDACGHKFEGVVQFWGNGGVGTGPRFKKIK
jgi:hypothetical protein